MAVIFGLIPVSVWNVNSFGFPWLNGQWQSNQRMTQVLFSYRIWQDSIPGLLYSPARGLIWFAPLFLFLLRRPDFSSPDSALLAGTLIEFIVVASFGKWWGGVSFGPRLLALSYWVAIFYVLQRPRRQAALPNAWFLVSCTCSLTVGLIGALRYHPTAWELRELELRDSTAIFRWSDTPWHEWFSTEEPRALKVKPAVLGQMSYCQHNKKAISSAMEP